MAAAPTTVSVIADTKPGPPVQHGLSKLKAEVEKKGLAWNQGLTFEQVRGDLVIVAGLSSGTGVAAQLLKQMGVSPLPSEPESLLIRFADYRGKRILVITGADDRGCMYALLDVADRVGWARDAAKPLSEVREAAEKPTALERGVTIYTMQQAHFEGRLHDEQYWARYFDMLAKNRFNTFQLLFAYEMDGYLYPPYPYFFDTEGFPDIHVVGLTKEQQTRNLNSLNRLVRMAHQRGIYVTIGIWDHIYRDLGVLSPFFGKRGMNGLVTGLTTENLLPYTSAALPKLISSVPNIDTIMFLMHGESGLTAEEMPPFWSEIWKVLKQKGDRIRYEARAKGVPDDLIENGINLGLKLRMNTKYWSEQVGLPFHPTHVQALNQFDRRHGYSDMLIYPRKYGLHWTLWTSGTTRILLFADPDYARRFAGTVHMSDTEGFDLIEPLGTKMAGHPHDMKPFDLLRPQYRYYDYEFERYWHFFQVFGRLSYNPATPSDVWQREFERRFGNEAGPLVEQVEHRASQILPRVVAYCLPAFRFSTTRGWPERQRWEDLPVYANSDPSDTMQFQSFRQAAQELLDGGSSAAVSPLKSSQWFAAASDDVLRLVADAQRRIGPQPSNEFVSTMTDMKILANLALYHSRRAQAGLSYALFNSTQDVNALDDAVAAERSAIEAWRGIVAAAGDVYTDDLMMGLADYDLSGHWRDELVKLEEGLSKLTREREAFHPNPRRIVSKMDPLTFSGLRRASEAERPRPRAQGPGLISLDLPRGDYELTVAIDGGANGVGPMSIESNGTDYSGIFEVPKGERMEKRMYTRVSDSRLHLIFDATSTGTWLASALTVSRVDPLIAHVPVRKLSPGRDLVLRATVSGISPIASVRVVYGDGIHGYRSQDMQTTTQYAYRTVIPAGNLQPSMSYFLEATDRDGRRSRWPASGGIAVTASADDEPPSLQHAPVTHAVPGKPLRIVAVVSDGSGVKWVRLRYRGLTQHQDFQTLEMLPTGKSNEYAAEIPGVHLDPKFDFMYLFEVMDSAGNGRIYPDLEKETPYVVVKMDRSGQSVQ
jgi:hypothetical protein